MENLVSNPGASRWIVTTPNRKNIRQNAFMGVHQQLLQQASTMLPDYETLSNSLIEQDLHSGAYSKVKNELDSNTSKYLEEYAKDPFYTFTKEGRKNLQSLKAIVSSPQIRKWSQQKVQNDTIRERVNENGMGSMYNVNNGQIEVIRNGKRMFVNDPIEGDIPITLDQSYQVIDNIGEGDYMVNMSKPDEVNKKIIASFANLGEDEWNTITSTDFLMKDHKQMNNIKQIEERLKYLMDAGLSQSDIDTLRSRAYQQAFQRGEIINSNEANKRVLDTLNSFANSAVKTESDVDFSENPQTKMKMEGQKMAAELNDTSAPVAFDFAIAKINAKPVNHGVFGTNVLEAKLSGELWRSTPGPNGVVGEGVTNLENNPMIQGVIDPYSKMGISSMVTSESGKSTTSTLSPEQWRNIVPVPDKGFQVITDAQGNQYLQFHGAINEAFGSSIPGFEKDGNLGDYSPSARALRHATRVNKLLREKNAAVEEFDESAGFFAGSNTIYGGTVIVPLINDKDPAKVWAQLQGDDPYLDRRILGANPQENKLNLSAFE